jgi:hypothetical protein
MSPLTHVQPGAPARATHEAEIKVACEQNADAVMAYIDEVLWRNLYPRTVWRVGTGSTASNHVAHAALDPGGDAVDVPADSYSAGSGVNVTTAQVNGKRVLGAINTLAPGPGQNRAPQFSRWYDGVILKAVAPTVPRPPPEVEPPAPATLPLNAKTYAQYIAQHADYGAAILRYYIRRRWRAEGWPVTTFGWGTATAVNVSAKTVTVQPEFPESPAPPAITVGFGTRAWAADQLVGKRVRIAYDPIIGNWIDDLA